MEENTPVPGEDGGAPNQARGSADTGTIAEPWPAFRGRDPAEARAFITEILESDLRGPFDQHERLSERPSSRYLVGMLAPVDTEIDASADEDKPGSDDGAESSDAGAP